MANVYRRGAVWYIRFTHRGREFRESSGSRLKSDALRLLRQRQDEARGGRKRRTFDEAMTRFINEHVRHNLKPSSAYRYIVSARVLREHFGGMGLDEITRGTLAAFSAERRKSVTPATVRRDLACLGSMFARAVEWEWCDANPVRSFRSALREAAPRTRFLSDDEYDRLLAVVNGDLRDITVIAVETGMRLGEILGLTWRDIDGQRREIRITESKTSSPRTVPMSDRALRTVTRRTRHIESPLVFCWPDGRGYAVEYVSRQFHRAVEKAGIRDFRFHDLRHTFASWAVQRGEDPYRVQRILGHKSAQMMQRYAHLRTEDLHEVVAKPGTRTRD